MCTKFEKMMHKKLHISSMRELTFFLGLQVTQKYDGVFIRQDNKILKKFSFSTVKTTSTPIETSKPFMKDENAEDVDVHLYRSMIGSLMYLTNLRLDIMFVVCACARFQVTPKVSYLHAVKRIFRYLQGQPKLGLWYHKDSPFDLEAYTDSDYVGASLDRKSTTGGCHFLRRRLISWKCKKQTVVANSTTEVELYTNNDWNKVKQLLRIELRLTLAKVNADRLTYYCQFTIGVTTAERAYLEKSAENVDFAEIVDFLNANPISEAWDIFKDLLRACPHHGFSELHQLDTFYNALNSKDQDSLNSAAGGNFLDRMPRDCLGIIESKSKVRYSRNEPVVAKVSTTASTSNVSPDVAELKDMVRALLLDKKGQSPAPVKADAKQLMEAIEKRFGGNAATKKTQKNLLKQQYENFSASDLEMLDKAFDRLQKLNIHAVVWRNKADLDTMSMDVLYYNLKVYKPEVNGFNTALGVSISGTQVNTVNIDNLSDVVICAFLASQLSSPQFVNEDLAQIHPDDLEEMDLRWQIAMLTMRARRFLKKIGRKLTVNGNDTIGFDKSNVECYNCHKR
nr:uncharacterized mitochondrial protein AtMg00810-like [Tanacetum cinerariifolium]